VVLVDQQGGRLFDFHMGHLVETEGHLGEEVRRLKRGSGSSRGGASRSGGGGGSRHDRETAVQNLRDTADATNRFFEQQGMKHLLIAGTDETVARFRDLLPKALQSAVVGTFPLNMNASHGEVLERSLEIVRQADQERELRLVNTVITAAAKGGNGVIRLDDTLSAVSEGRVQTLVVSAGYHAPGYRCQSCSYLTAQALAGCPFCGGSIHEIPDAVELAIQRAMQQGIEVEIVEKKDQLDAAGGIGALLRY
jgi:peptide subunit release factor 1 (eRF1)